MQQVIDDGAAFWNVSLSVAVAAGGGGGAPAVVAAASGYDSHLLGTRSTPGLLYPCGSAAKTYSRTSVKKLELGLDSDESGCSFSI